MTGSFNDEHYINSVIENNICLYANAATIDMRNTAAPALGVRHGVMLRNNVYVLGSDKQLRMMEYMDEGTRVGAYARYRYGDSAGVIAHLQRLGIETGSKFYYDNGYFNDLEASGAYR